MNTVIPHADPRYRDNRPVVGVPDGRIVKLNDSIGFHPEVGPLKRFWDAGDMAIIHGVGYANSPRSHFRSMDIWHTCEPDKLGTEGWLGPRATRDMDPNKSNVITAVNFGPSLPRALALPGVPVACIDDLDNFGMLTSIQEEIQREKIINRFTRLYAPHHRQRLRDGLPGPDRAGQPQSCRYPQGRPRAIQQRRRVSGYPDCP